MNAFNPWSWRDERWLARNRDRTETATTGQPSSDYAQSGYGEAAAEGYAQAGADVVGYDVEAVDGKIGSIDEASTEVGASYLVVDTGPWIFGRKVLLPAGTVQRIDHEQRKVYVDRTKDQIKDSPEYDEATFGTPEYRDRVGDYYTDSYRTTPPL